MNNVEPVEPIKSAASLLKVSTKTVVPADLLQAAAIKCASDLIELGAKRSTVTSLCKGIKEPTFRRLSQAFHGTPGQQGRNRETTGLYFSKPSIQLQSTTLGAVYLDLRERGSNRAESLIHAFLFYREAFDADAQSLNLDQAFVLTRFIEQQTILAEVCPDCGSLFLRDIDTPMHHALCLTCKPVRKPRSVSVAKESRIAA